MTINDALQYLDSWNFIEFGNSLDNFYLNFKLKGKHYFKAFWIDYNGTDKLIIRVKAHKYKTININKVEKASVNFFQKNEKNVIDSIDLIKLCSELKKSFRNEGLLQRFYVSIDGISAAFEIVKGNDSLEYLSALYRAFCILKTLQGLNLDDLHGIIDDTTVISTSVGDQLSLVLIDGKDVVLDNNLNTENIFEEQ